MNKCEGAFRLPRSMLSTAEREVRCVSVQKDGLSPGNGALGCRAAQSGGRAVISTLRGFSGAFRAEISE